MIKTVDSATRTTLFLRCSVICANKDVPPSMIILIFYESFIFRELQESFDDGLVRAAQEGHMQNIENGVNFSQFMKDAKVIFTTNITEFNYFSSEYHFVVKKQCPKPKFNHLNELVIKCLDSINDRLKRII